MYMKIVFSKSLQFLKYNAHFLEAGKIIHSKNQNTIFNLPIFFQDTFDDFFQLQLKIIKYHTTYRENKRKINHSIIIIISNLYGNCHFLNQNSSQYSTMHFVTKFISDNLTCILLNFLKQSIRGSDRLICIISLKSTKQALCSHLNSELKKFKNEYIFLFCNSMPNNS